MPVDPEVRRPAAQSPPKQQNEANNYRGSSMSSFRQIAANRRNARKSTGPTTEDGKRRSLRNAVRHGLTAETAIGALDDAEDYQAFEAAIMADYDAQSAVERLARVMCMWRLRRATTIETGLFEMQADQLHEFRRAHNIQPDSQKVIYAIFPGADAVDTRADRASVATTTDPNTAASSVVRQRTIIMSSSGAPHA
jgi:hypothetical protein